MTYIASYTRPTLDIVVICFAFGPKLSMPANTRKHAATNTQEKSGYISSIYEDMIIDGKTGQDSIHCDGTCKTWLHRCCAGLSKDVLSRISTPDSPFHCMQCQVDAQEKKIKELKAMVSNI